MKNIASWALRALIVAACLFLTARTARIALADLRAQRNGAQGLESAIALEPGDSVLVARAALLRNANGDTSPQLDQDLRHAAELDPLNADIPIALGLREEFRGNPAEAERDLIHAADIDHTFKPAWTLANFYVRNNQPEKIRPMIARILNLDPLGYDPAPVFDLCWNEAADSKSIAALLPSKGAVPLQYLYYLLSRKHIDAAVEFWPRALAAAKPPDQGLADLTTWFVENLQQADRVPDAVRVWNQLVDHNIVQSGKLDPERSVSIANPDFRFPPLERAFGWRISHDNGISVIPTPAGLRFEFDGNEPEVTTILSTFAPLLPGKEYRLAWQTDASELSSHQDPGFFWQIIPHPGDPATVCAPMLRTGDTGECRFTGPPQPTASRLDLIYKRALGTTRVQGVLRIESVRLNLGS